MVMVFNATFNNSTVTSWCSVLLVDETGEPRENHQLPQVTNKLKIFKQYFTLRVFFYILFHSHYSEFLSLDMKNQ